MSELVLNDSWVVTVYYTVWGSYGSEDRTTSEYRIILLPENTLLVVYLSLNVDDYFTILFFRVHISYSQSVTEKRKIGGLDFQSKKVFFFLSILSLRGLGSFPLSRSRRG